MTILFWVEIATITCEPGIKDVSMKSFYRSILVDSNFVVASTIVFSFA